MADFKEGQGVKTHTDDDFCTKIADGQSGASATHKLSVVQEGDTKTTTNDFGVPWMAVKPNGEYCVPKTDDDCRLVAVLDDDADDSKQHSYKNHSAITASTGTDDHDSAVIPSGETVDEIKVSLSSPGCMKYEIGEFDGTSTFTVHATLWTQPASPSFSDTICLPTITGDGSKTLRIRASNKDDTDNDAYSTMCYKTTAP